MINLRNIKSIIANSFVIAIFLSTTKVSIAMEYKKIVLPNQLEAYVIKSRNPIVTHAIVYNVGSMEENSSKEGIAHYLEHSMFLGTNRVSKQRFAEEIKEMGAYYNAFTSYDLTLYYLSMPARYLEKAMRIEADRMKWLLLDEKLVENEKHVINEERNMYNNQVYNTFFEQVNQYLYPTTNYGRSVIGWTESFNKVTVKDLKNFYDTWYSPNNAKIFIIGDVDMEETENLVKKYYSKLAITVKDFDRPDYLEKPYKTKLEISFKDKRIQQEIISKSYLVPSLVSDSSKARVEGYSLLVLDVLLGSKTSKIYTDLVLKQKLATDVSLSYSPDKKGHSDFSFTLVPNQGVSKKVILQALDNSLRDIAIKGFSQQEVKEAVKNIKDNLEFLKEDETEYVFMIAKYVNAGLSFDEVLELPHRMNSIKNLEINKTYRKYFINSNYVVSVASN